MARSVVDLPREPRTAPRVPRHFRIPGGNCCTLCEVYVCRELGFWTGRNAPEGSPSG